MTSRPATAAMVMPANRAPDEHRAIAWFDVEAMPRLAHPEVHTALEVAVLCGGSAGFGV